MAENQKRNWRNLETGALWKSKNGNGLSGKTNKTRLLALLEQVEGDEVQWSIFKNTYKTEGSNEPDYRLYMSNDIEGLEATTGKSAPKAATKPAPKQAAPKKPAPQQQEESVL